MIFLEFLILVLGVAGWFVMLKKSKGADVAEARLKSTLMEGEVVVASGCQMRAAAPFNRRQLVAITNSRLIKISRGLFNNFSMIDYQWKDLKDAQVSDNIMSGVFGSNLKFKVLKGPELVILGIPNATAEAIYRHAQQQEQAWEEKRRVRELEEKRASSGGVVIGSMPGAMGGAASSMGSTLDELEKAKKMLDAGLISDAEFHEIKAKILARV